MTKTKTPPFIGVAFMAAGGLFLVFVVFQFQGMNRHERNFVRLCKEIAKAHGYDSKTMRAYCNWLRRDYVGDRAPMRVTTPEKLGARKMPHDKEARILIAQDPYYFAALSYCYFSFRKWFLASKIQPQNFAMMTEGFSVLKSELIAYMAWMDTPVGKECLAKVHEKLKLKYAVDLVEELKGKAALIALNPIAFIGLGKTRDEIRDAVNVTLDHERLHMLYGYCPKLQKWAEKSLERKHSAYDNQFDPEASTTREHLAHVFESDPDLINARLGRCIF